MIPDSVQLKQEAVSLDAPAVTVQREQKKSVTDAVYKNNQAAVEAEKAEKTTSAKKVAETQKAETSEKRERDKDQVNIHFSLNATEKEAFQKYFERAEKPDEPSSFLSDEDYETIQKAAERITEAMDETIDRYQKSNERANKAVSEWYLQLSRGNTEPKMEFVQFLRDAAAGKFDY
jgi:hypothetical protein